MRYVIINELGELVMEKGVVKEFDSGLECSKYFDKMKFDRDKYKIVVDGIDEKKNSEFLDYLK